MFLCTLKYNTWYECKICKTIFFGNLSNIFIFLFHLHEFAFGFNFKLSIEIKYKEILYQFCYIDFCGPVVSFADGVLLKFKKVKRAGLFINP